MEKIIEDIIQKKKHVYFISPSFGDVAAYAGDLLTFLSGKVDITVINVFTNGGDGKNTFSAKQYLKSFSIPTSQRLYEVLDASDTTALASFSANKVNLGFIDALWRRKKKRGLLTRFIGSKFVEMESIYPLFATHVLSGRIAKDDSATAKELVIKLRDLVSDIDNSIVFCPLGYGKHVDYLLVRNACSHAFEKNVIYCADISAVVQLQERERFIRTHRLIPFLYDAAQTEMKRKLLKSYKQFENKEEEYMHPEAYYLPQTVDEQPLALEIRKYKNELPEHLLREWDLLWETSAYKHYFNSSVWFRASKEAFPITDFFILTIYEGPNLMAVLPLVKEKKYGINVYKLPGGRYFDRSPLLLKEFDTKILSMLFSAAKEVGNFYLSEIDRFTLDSVLPFIRNVSTAETSTSPYWKLPPDAYRFLLWKHKKAILKRQSDEDGNFDLEIYTGDVSKHLPTLMEIEKESSKGRDFKDTFSDKHLLALYNGLETFSPGSLWFLILYYKKEPICYNYGFTCDSVYSSCGTSFKLSYRQFAPGLLLTYLALPKLVEMGITLFDFSRGISRYKREFTPYSYQQYAIVYGKNFFVHIWLSLWDTLRIWLERNPQWYERVRIVKNKLVGR